MISRFFVSRCIRQLSMAAFSAKAARFHIRTLSAIPISHDVKDLFMPKQLTPNLLTCRYKSKKKSKKEVQKDEESDDEVDEEMEDDESSEALPGEKIFKMAQVRLDKVMRHAMKSSRIVDEAVLEGRLRKNDSKALKKSAPVQEGDILDIEVGPDPKNRDFIKVHRVEVLEIKEGQAHCAVRVLITKNLTIKPYE